MKKPEPSFAGFINAVRGVCHAIERLDLNNTQPLLTALVDLLREANSLTECSIESNDDDLQLTSNIPPSVSSIPDSLVFYVVFNPLDPKTICATSLKDAIGDIYESLEPGLRLLDREPQKQVAVIWEWRHGFEFHWGRHLLDLIRLLALEKAIGVAV